MTIEKHLYISGSSVPDCCWNCKNYEFDSKDEYSPNYYYCKLGIAMPTKKKSCKKQNYTKQGETK